MRVRVRRRVRRIAVRAKEEIKTQRQRCTNVEKWRVTLKYEERKTETERQ